MTEESHESSRDSVNEVLDSTGHEELDQRLAEPVLKGQQGLDKAMVWAACFLIVIAGLIAYVSVFAVPFHAGETELLTGGGALGSAARWTEDVEAGAPAPLTLLSLAMNGEIAPGNVAAFRIVNLLLHLLNGVLVYLLCRRLLGERVTEAVTLIAGLVFVLHPVNVEAVASVFGRGPLFGTFWALVSTLLYVQATRNPKGLRMGCLGLALVACACAFGSWYGAWCLPVLIILVDASVNDCRPFRHRLFPVLSYFAVLAMLGVVFLVAGGYSGFGAFNESTATAIAAIGNVAVRAVWPFGLSVYPTPWGLTALSGVAAAIVICIGLAGAISAIRWRWAGGAAVAWFALALAGASLTARAEDFLTDRMLYFALAGLVWLVPWAFAQLPEQPGVRTGAGLVCAGLLLFSGIGVFARTTTWQSEIALWRDAASKAPGEIVPKERVGVAYLAAARRQLSEAAVLQENGYESEASEVRAAAGEHLAEGRAILGSLPKDALSAEALYVLGIAHKESNDGDAALESFLLSLRKDDTNLGCVLEGAQLLLAEAASQDDQSALLRALDLFDYARKLGHLPPAGWSAYGSALARAGRFEEAVQALSTAVKEVEDGPTRYGEELKAVQTALQQVRALEGRAQELQSSEPGSLEARLMAAQSLIVRNRPLQASYLLENVLAHENASASAWVLLGFVRARMGQADMFLSGRPAPPGPDQQHAQSWAQLAQLCASRGEWDAAEHYLLSVPAGMGGVRTPLVSLGILSLQLRQGKRAYDYLRQATEAYPDEFAPWLALCDLSMAQGNAAAARQFLAEAEKRKAPAGEITRRQESLGGGVPDVPSQPGEVIIR